LEIFSRNAPKTENDKHFTVRTYFNIFDVFTSANKTATNIQNAVTNIV